jgi:REP element-mobilizing transposase RayT
MPRPPRLEVAGGVYHVTTRANAGRLVFADDDERQQFLMYVDELVQLREWSCRSYCLLSTHYHLLFMTPQPDLAAGMQWLNGRFAQWANWQREEETHVFGGRYGARRVTTEAHALEVHRYIALNPVRAGLVRDPRDWPWSSLASLLGERPPEAFLDVRGALEMFGTDLASARRRLRKFVWDGLREDSA